MVLLNNEAVSNFLSENNPEDYKNGLELLTHILSHDLKKPLRVLTNNSEELLKLDKKSNFDEIELLTQEIFDTSLELQKMINILLEYTRLGIFKPDYNIINTGEIINKIFIDLKDQIKQTEATINSDPLPSIIGHEKQIMILFKNIIENSLRYVTSDKIPIIDIFYIKHNDIIEFIISDNGIGVEEEYFEIIFLLFQRLHTREEYPGIGAGLAIAKKIVEAHGGRIWINSTLDQGTQIHFTLRTNQKEDNNEKL